ncbi:MAG: isopentenyl phosphate kinase [Candidatus Kariarchaeaceae archaeon]
MGNYLNDITKLIEEKGLTIIKIGGAAITDKNKESTLRGDVLNRAMMEIKTSGLHPIIVHGAGSFAHNLAKRFQLKNGFEASLAKDYQRTGVATTRSSLQTLHNYVLKAALDADLFPFSVPVSATMITKGAAKTEDFFIKSLFLSYLNGFVPINHGDICMDSMSGFRVVSGDRIIKQILDNLNSIVLDKSKVHVIFGSNVDGIFDKDPQLPDANLLKNIDYSQLQQAIDTAQGSDGVDITGGMKGKLLEIKEIVDCGFRASVVNLTVADRLYNLLSGKKTTHTRINPNHPRE